MTLEDVQWYIIHKIEQTRNEERAYQKGLIGSPPKGTVNTGSLIPACSATVATSGTRKSRYRWRKRHRARIRWAVGGGGLNPVKYELGRRPQEVKQHSGVTDKIKTGILIVKSFFPSL